MCRQFTCKYHGWRYDLDGKLTFVQQEERVLRPRQEPLRAGAGALRGLGRLHLRQLRQQPRAVAARVPRPDGHRPGGLPVRPDDLALVLPHGGQRELEALHGRVPGVLPRTGPAREPVADGVLEGGRARPASRRRTTGSTARTGWSAPRACAPGRWPTRCASRSRTSARAACSGLGTSPDLGEMPAGLNPPSAIRGDWIRSSCSPTSSSCSGARAGI